MADALVGQSWDSIFKVLPNIVSIDYIRKKIIQHMNEGEGIVFQHPNPVDSFLPLRSMIKSHNGQGHTTLLTSRRTLHQQFNDNSSTACHTAIAFSSPSAMA